MKQSRTNLLPSALAALGTACLPITAFAHVGHGVSAGATAGLLHPLTGLDHLLAMIAVGVWAAQVGGRRVWVLPVTFLACMICGGMLAVVSLPEQVVEGAVLTSVLALGALIVFSVRAPVIVALAIVGGFGAFHGYAHGAELPAAGSAISYGLGFAISTASMHALGVLTCLAAGKATMGPRLVRIGGVGVIACGGLLLVGAL